MRRIGRNTAVAALTSVTLALTATAAAAGEGETATLTDVVAAAADAAGAAGQVVEPTARGGEFTGETEMGTVTVDAAGGQVTVDDGGLGEPVSIGLPGELVPGATGIAEDGSIVFEGADTSTDVVVQLLEDGARISTVIGDADAPSRYAYPLDGGTVPFLEEDGSVSLLQELEVTLPDTGQTVTATAKVGTIAAPWAIDATGREVPTHYEVEGSVLIQVVEHVAEDTAYPVVADPQYSRSWFNSYIWFNRAETKTIASGGWGAATLTGLCTAAGGPVAGAVCGLAAGSLVYTAGVAENSSPKRCVALRMTSAIVVNYPSVFTYRDSRCA